MRLLQPLPDQVLRGAHDRATLYAAGVTARELQGPLWSSNHRGLWFWAASNAGALERARRARGLVPDGGAIGGWAAGALLGATHLDGEAADGRLLPVPVCCGRQQTCRRRQDVVVWRSDLHDGDVIDVHGLPVTSPERTCFDLARFSPTLRDGVTAVEALLRSPALPELNGVTELLEQRRRFRGVPRARRVLELADGRTGSPGESWLRLVWMLDAGLPPPLVNVPIRGPDGFLLGVVDLLDIESGLVGEYDGAVHADARSRADNHLREEQLERSGLTVVRFTSVDIGSQVRRTAHRLQAGRAAGLRRDRSRDRWQLG